jgi:hypothetical protein
MVVNIDHARLDVIGSTTYATEEVSDEHDDLSVLCVIELIESGGLATLVKNLQLACLAKSLLVGFGVGFTLL